MSSSFFCVAVAFALSRSPTAECRRPVLLLTSYSSHNGTRIEARSQREKVWKLQRRFSELRSLDPRYFDPSVVNTKPDTDYHGGHGRHGQGERMRLGDIGGQHGSAISELPCDPYKSVWSVSGFKLPQRAFSHCRALAAAPEDAVRNCKAIQFQCWWL